MSGRPATRAAGLSAEQICDVALRILNDDGLEALTFRVLARELGVTSRAVTYHVGSRRELLVRLVERVYAGVETKISVGVGVEAEPRAELRALLCRYVERVLAHPQLTMALFADPSLIGEPLRRLTAQIADGVAALGAAPSEVETGVHVLVDYTHGFALSTATYQPPPEDDARGRSRLTPPGLEEFALGLDWILRAVA